MKARNIKLIGVENILETLTRRVSVIGQVVLMAMVALTIVDVVLRRIFNRPLSAGLEISQIMLVVVVFTSIAYCGMRKSHVSIDAIASRLPTMVQKVLQCIIDLFGVLLFIAMGWGGIVLALDKFETHSVTGILPIPIYPFVFTVSFGSLLLAVVLIVQFINSVLRMVNK